MKQSKCALALILMITSITRAQSSPGIVGVNADTGSIVNSPAKDDVKNWRLSYKTQELSLVSVENLPTAPLHIVFVLDVSRHQQRLLPLTLDYLEQLAGVINNSQPDFTVVPATQNADVIVQAHTAAELRTRLTTMDSSALASLASNPSLPAGILKGLKLLGAQSGSRVVVLFADDNDEIDSASQKALKLKLAAAHVRCFTILVSNHDFFGTKARSRRADKIESLASFSGGQTYETDWQRRSSDITQLQKAAFRISQGTVLNFEFPQASPFKPGVYKLRARFAGGQREFSTSPVIVVRP